MATIDDNSALLLYRVGPVLCAAPCLPISAIIQPPSLTRTPGSGTARPGIFKYANAIVSSLDLRYKFGVEQSEWAVPGRTIVTQLGHNHIGFFVDEILDVMSMPTSGWGALPALLPRGIFTRTLTLNDHIYLYADFNDLQRIPDSGYLRQYIQHLLEAKQQATKATQHSRAASTATAHNVSVQARARTPQTTLNDSAAAPASATTAVPKPVSLTPTEAKTPRQATEKTKSPPLRSASAPARTSQAVSPKPRPTTDRPKPTAINITAAHRQTPAQTPSPTTATPRRPKPVTTDTVNHATTTRANRPSPQESDRDNNSLLPLLAMMLLLFGAIGIGLWYVFREDTNQHPAVVVTPTSTDSSQTVAPAPAIAQPQTAVAPREVTSATATPPPSPHSTQTRPAHTDTPPPKHVAASRPPNQTAPVTNTSSAATTTSSATEHDDYHARIEQDQQGLTITLDVPADDPAFTQPRSTTSTTDTATTLVTKPDRDTSTAVKPSTATRETSSKHAPGTAPSAAPQTVEIIHVVVKGDTLWDIAKRYVRDPFRYPELARLSKIKNPDLIYPGDRVRIIKRKRQP